MEGVGGFDAPSDARSASRARGAEVLRISSEFGSGAGSLAAG